MTLKLGRKPASFSAHAMKASYNANAILASFGPPPLASADFVRAVDKHTGGDWRMMLNDQLGCCTASDSGHALMLRTANVGQMITPTDDDILHMYENFGYNPEDPSTDQGAAEIDVTRVMGASGLLGHKSIAHAAIVTGAMRKTSVDHLKWAVQIFGTVRLGVNLPNEAMNQFDQHKPWDLGGDETIDGGHDVPIVRYDQQYAYVVTWGRLHPVTWPWLMKFCEEAWGEVYPDFIRATGTSPSGFHLSTIVRDLGALATN